MHNQHFFHFFRSKELNEMYVSIAIRSFALSLIGIFVPIYLYKIGYPLVSVFLFYAMQSFLQIFFSIPAAKISSKYGIKHSILFSVPLLIVFFFLLYSLESVKVPLFALAFFAASSTSMFWIPYHIDFAKFSDRKNRGKELSTEAIFASVISVAAPILGAIILTLTGFKVLFVLVSALLIVSVVPLFLSKEIHQPTYFSAKGFFKGQSKRDVISFLGHGIENKMSAIVWPIFIFVFIFGEKYTSLGILSSIMLVVALISTFFIGKFSDISRRGVLKFGSVLNSGVWVARSFVFTPLQVFFTEFVYGISHPTMHIPFDALNYDKARKKKLTKMILEREIYHNVGVFILFVFLMLFAGLMTQAFRYGGPISSLMRFFF